MRVRLKNNYAGPRGTFSPGDVAELPDEEAAGLIAGGFAEAMALPTAQPRRPESAMLDTPERAVINSPQPRTISRRPR